MGELSHWILLIGTLLFLVDLAVGVVVAFYFSIRFNRALGTLLAALPPEAREQLVQSDRERYAQSGVRYYLRTQFLGSVAILALIETDKFDKFGIQAAREQCLRFHRGRKKVVGILAIMLASLVVLLGLGVTWLFLKG